MDIIDVRISPFQDGLFQIAVGRRENEGSLQPLSVHYGSPGKVAEVMDNVFGQYMSDTLEAMPMFLIYACPEPIVHPPQRPKSWWARLTGR